MDIIIKFIRQIKKNLLWILDRQSDLHQTVSTSCVPTYISYQKSEDLNARRATANNTNGLQMIVTNVTT